MPMIAPLLVALTLGQVQPTPAEIKGTLNSMQIAVLAARAGTRTITNNGARTRACIAFEGGGSAPGGSVTVRYGVVLLSPGLQYALGLKKPAYAATWYDVLDEYAAVEVQGVPDTVFRAGRLVDNMDVYEEELDKRAAPVQASCEVYAVRSDDAANVFRCACSTGVNCTWTPPLPGGGYGPSEAAPTHRTLPPLLWSGTGCVAKPCVSRFEGYGSDRTWPSTCP